MPFCFCTFDDGAQIGGLDDNLLISAYTGAQFVVGSGGALREARVSPRDLGWTKRRTWVGIAFVNQHQLDRKSCEQGRHAGADVETAQSGAVEVVAIVEAVGRHPTEVWQAIAARLKDRKMKGGAE